MMKDRLKLILLIVLDALVVNISYLLALLGRFDFSASGVQFEYYLSLFVSNAVVITVIKLVIFAFMSLYRSLWKYASTDELVKIVLAGILGNAFTIAYMGMTVQALPRSVYLFGTLLDIAFVGAIRFSYRFIRDMRTPGMFNLGNKEEGEPGIDRVRRIMVVGAGDAGAALIKEVKLHSDQRQKVVVAVDDSDAKIGQRIAGVKIAGSRDDIPRLVRKYRIDEIMIAIPSASKKQIQGIVEICHKTRCKVKIMPALIDLINGKVSIKSLRDVDIDDLLGRDPVKLDLKGISTFLEERIVLVTGAGGSIGSELCRQIAGFKPRRLVLVDIYENSLFELAGELSMTFPELALDVNVGSVRDRVRMDEIFNKYKPHVVFHAAAHKHVPLMEGSPKEAIINNVLGTEIVMDMAEKYVADKFVLISTDKAVNPTNVMGATKRLCEMLLQEKSAKNGKTSFSAVRFGNVLGSNGSVIPTFRRQIAMGGPVTVTHPDITRYFMTIPEAVQLVLQAGAMAKGGEIFILDMGEPVKILDLAENVIRLSGLEPYEDIDIKITGLRPGEKLYEELLLAEEGIKETTHDKIFVGHPIETPQALKELLAEDGALEAAVMKTRTMSDAQAREWLETLVPTFKEAVH